MIYIIRTWDYFKNANVQSPFLFNNLILGKHGSGPNLNINDVWTEIIIKNAFEVDSAKRIKYIVTKKKPRQPLLQRFGWGLSWISESVLAGKHQWWGLPSFRCFLFEGWCNMSNRYGNHSLLATQLPLIYCCSCHPCVARQTLPAATAENSVEEVWNLSRSKGEREAEKEVEGVS